jgi:Skp family chaperone for outer membrane proteins
MPDEADKTPFGFLPKITTRGDIGAAGLGLAIGFFLDSAIHPFGIQPGTASLYSAAAAVGVKNSIQAWRESRVQQVVAVAIPNQKEKLERAAEQVSKQLETIKKALKDETTLETTKDSAEQALRELRINMEWWSAELITDTEFQNTLKQSMRRSVELLERLKLLGNAAARTA